MHPSLRQFVYSPADILSITPPDQIYLIWRKWSIGTREILNAETLRKKKILNRVSCLPPTTFSVWSIFIHKNCNFSFPSFLTKPARLGLFFILFSSAYFFFVKKIKNKNKIVSSFSSNLLLLWLQAFFPRVSLSNGFASQSKSPRILSKKSSSRTELSLIHHFQS